MSGEVVANQSSPVFYDMMEGNMMQFEPKTLHIN